MKKNTLLNKIIFKKSSRFTLIFGIFGFILGWVILLFSIDFYYKTQLLFKTDDSKEYLIISKEINTLSFGDKKHTFSPQDLEELKKQPFIKRVSPFLTNLFEVWTTGNFMVRIQTELFFESLDENMLDVHPEEFVWNERSK